MAEVFVGRFITNSWRSKGLDTLMMIRLGDNESIKDYSARFWETYNDIDVCGRIQRFRHSNWAYLPVLVCASP